MMAAVAKYYQEPRRTWVCDSFEGMPHSDDPAEDYDKMPYLKVTMDEVRESFRLYNMMYKIMFVPGWFKDTIPKVAASIRDISVLRLDNDYYESTSITLRYMYPHVSEGGYIIVDDYDCCPGCNRAVDEYRTEFGITNQLFRMSKTSRVGVYWQKRPQRPNKIF
jgi:O-methyltransferase